MKTIFICLSIICMSITGGCSTFQTAYFGVEDEAIQAPSDFGDTRMYIEKAKSYADSLYAEKQIDKAMELGKTAAITYWECYDQEAKNLLALARQAALKAEAFYPQHAPPPNKRINETPGSPDIPEAITPPELSAVYKTPAPDPKIERATEKIKPAASRTAPPPEIKEKPSAQSPTQSQYAIQIAAYKKPADAERLKRKVAAVGYPVYLQKKEVDGATWHRVRVGPYLDKKKAREVMQEFNLTDFAPESFLVKKK